MGVGSDGFGLLLSLQSRSTPFVVFRALLSLSRKHHFMLLASTDCPGQACLVSCSAGEEACSLRLHLQLPGGPRENKDGSQGAVPTGKI